MYFWRAESFFDKAHIGQSQYITLLHCFEFCSSVSVQRRSLRKNLSRLGLGLVRSVKEMNRMVLVSLQRWRFQKLMSTITWSRCWSVLDLKFLLLYHGQYFADCQNWICCNIAVIWFILRIWCVILKLSSSKTSSSKMFDRLTPAWNLASLANSLAYLSILLWTFSLTSAWKLDWFGQNLLGGRRIVKEWPCRILRGISCIILVKSRSLIASWINVLMNHTEA